MNEDYLKYIEEMREEERRKGGRRTFWYLGNTRAIKIPEELIAEVLEYAHRLDEERWKDQGSNREVPVRFKDWKEAKKS